MTKGFMKKIILCIILIYSLYFIQIHLLIQNIYALAPLLKSWNKNIFFDSAHSFYTYISIMPNQSNIEITKTMSQVTPDRYIPPPPILPKYHHHHTPINNVNCHQHIPTTIIITTTTTITTTTIIQSFRYEQISISILASTNQYFSR